MQTLKPKLSTLRGPTPKSVTQTVRIRGSSLQKIRREKLLRNPACEECERKGLVTPAVVIDHVVPLFQGGAESDANRQSLCIPCHDEKSAGEAKMRG